MATRVENKKKKVLFLITKSNWGGAQRYVYDLATNLPSSDYEVVVALGGDGELKKRLDGSGVRTVRINDLQRDISVFKEFKAAGELYKIIRSERPDILHINSSKAGVIGSYVGRLARVPYIIFTAHGWAFNEDRPFHQRVFIKLFHWLTVILAHRTIAVSSGLKAQLDWPLVQNKMVVIHPGRAPIDFIPKLEARRILSEHSTKLLPPEATIIGSIGELHPIKRFSLLIRSFKELDVNPSTYLFIIGEGEEHQKLEQLIRDEHLSDRVFLTGAIPEAARLLKAFDVFVLPSKSESFGYVLVEASLAGLPIVASRVGGIPDIITHQNNGLLFDPEKPDELTSTLQYVYDNSSVCTSLAAAAEKSSADFSIPKMIERTMALYEARSSRD